MEESPPQRRRSAPAARLYDQELAGDAAAGAAPAGTLGTGEEHDPAADAAAAPPAVVAVLVTSGGADLEAAVASLRAQDYPNLAVLVIDAGSPGDVTGRVAAVLPTAYIRRLPGNPGFAAAANEAIAAVEGAPFLLVCRDQAVLEPAAVRTMVEEAYRSNAGLVGPKIVDADRPDVLLEVGLAIDKFGATHSAIEPGELDQEQHDAVRDVFYVSSIAFLIRADLFRALGGFDAALGDTGEDLDLCWRARLAGARVLVVPDARVRLPARALALDAAARHSEHRNRIRTLLKTYSFTSLVRVVPQAMAFTLLEVLALLMLRRREQARALINGWTANLRRAAEVRRMRRATQNLRAVADSDVRFLQVTGSARARDFIMGRIEHGGRARALLQTSRDMVDATADRLHWAPVAGWVLLMALPLFGARELITHGVPGIGSMLPMPSVAALVRDFTASWRFSGLGSAAPPPTAFAVLAVTGSVVLGATALLRTIAVVAAIPVGALAMYRLAKSRALPAGAAGIAAAAYAVNPVARNAIANGRFGSLLLFAAGPYLLHGLLRHGEAAPPVRRGWRGLVPIALLTAALSALYPPAALFGPIAAIVLMGVSGTAGGAGSGFADARRTLAAALAVTALTVVLLLPWSLTLLLPGANPAAAGFAFRPRLGVAAVLGFHTGPAGAGPLGGALAVAALLGVFVAGRERARVAVQGWALALAGLTIAWMGGQQWSGGPWPAPETALALAAIGVALAIGAGAAAVRDELPTLAFGGRHAASVAGGAALLVAVVLFTGSVADGRYELPPRGWASTLSWMDARRGEFRVLWTGPAEVLPLDPWTLPDGTAWGLTRNGPGDSRDLWPVGASGTTGLVADALRDALTGRSTRLGHQLAPMGVRYVAVPQRRGPSGAGRLTRQPRLESALAAQVDLRSLPIQRGLVLYENTAWIPIGAIVARTPAGDSVRADTGEPAGVLGRHGWRGASSRTREPGRLLWSESFDSRWEVTVNGRRAAHQRSFGWANAFVVDRPGRVTIRHRGLPLRAGGVLVQVGLWSGALTLWWRERRRRPAAVASALPVEPPPPASAGAEDHAGEPLVPAAIESEPRVPSPLDLPVDTNEVDP